MRSIVLGVTGCIGAYKSAVILRLLQREGFDVFPVMTRSAQKFITPLTLEKLSRHRVVMDMFDGGEEEGEIEHIALARRSHLLLVAPATANLLAKFARGMADDFLSTLYLSTTTPVIVAPAMNVEMWNHPATQTNLEVLRERGVQIIEPGSGYLACGELGEGRLAEPEQILEAVLNLFGHNLSLAGTRVLVTAGPTVEDLDPVRFLSNRSSGKMGYAVAREAAWRGAEVILVSGPTQLDTPPGVEKIQVRSAAEMAQQVLERFASVDVVVMAAAVSDFTPASVATEKIKKGQAEGALALKRTVDILAELGKRRSGQYLVGFAAESENLIANARGKLAAKGLDLVLANDISIAGQGFQSDYNQVTLVDAEGEEQLPRLRKEEVARHFCDRLEKSFSTRPTVG